MLNPDEEREGPLSVKVQYPFSNHNQYFYLLADNPENVKDLGYALKGEFLDGTAELGSGIYWKPDIPPHAMATLTFGSGDFNFFAEAVGSYGTQKHIIDEVAVSMEYPLGLSVQQSDEIYFSGLAGLSWNWTDDDNWFNLSGLSGMVIPRLSFDIIGIFDLSVSIPINYGNIGEEYSGNGTAYGAHFTLSMGDGRF